MCFVILFITVKGRRSLLLLMTVMGMMIVGVFIVMYLIVIIGRGHCYLQKNSHHKLPPTFINSFLIKIATSQAYTHPILAYIIMFNTTIHESPPDTHLTTRLLSHCLSSCKQMPIPSSYDPYNIVAYLSLYCKEPWMLMSCTVVRIIACQDFFRSKWMVFINLIVAHHRPIRSMPDVSSL